MSSDKQASFQLCDDTFSSESKEVKYLKAEVNLQHCFLKFMTIVIGGMWFSLERNRTWNSNLKRNYRSQFNGVKVQYLPLRFSGVEV